MTQKMTWGMTPSTEMSYLEGMALEWFEPDLLSSSDLED
ncbi:hypothetical protein ID866_10198 [Astraeus odoratus]|nr:hypothetical protein ID866_10198 [Astraeus odoratus]